VRDLKWARAHARQQRVDAAQRLDSAQAMIRDLNDQLRKGADNSAISLQELSRLRGLLETDLL